MREQRVTCASSLLLTPQFDKIYCDYPYPNKAIIIQAHVAPMEIVEGTKLWLLVSL